MKVLLINPPSDFHTLKTHETLGLGYLAAALEQAGHEAEIYDCNFQDASVATIADRVSRTDYGMVGITTMIGKTANALKIAIATSEVSQALVVLGGYTATFEYERLLTDYPVIDAVVRGEAEETVGELAALLEEGRDWRAVRNIAFRAHGTVIANPMRPCLQDLDVLPLPRRSPFLHRIGLASILSSRGCFGRCSFCNIQEFYNLSGRAGIRVRSPRNVTDEIEYLYRHHGSRKFLFIDDNMLGAERSMPGRTARIATEIFKRELDIDLEVSARADDVINHEGTLVALKQAGLTRVYVGIESGSQTQLDRQRKGVTVEQNRRALEILKEHALDVDLGFIPFDPWTTVPEVIDNMHFLAERGLMTARNLNTSAVTTILYPGTVMHRHAKAEGLFVAHDDFTYSYRFKHKECKALFTRIIHYIKARPVLEPIERYLAWTRKDAAILEETKRIVDPMAVLLFALWAEMFELWCKGYEAPALEARVHLTEALLYNFCNSLCRHRELLSVLPEALNVEGRQENQRIIFAYAEMRRELGRMLCSVISSARPRIGQTRWSDPFYSDRLYMYLLWKRHCGAVGPSARHYQLSPCDEDAILLAKGKVGTCVSEYALPRPPLVVGSRLFVGLNIFVPPDVFVDYVRRQIASQVEKFDTAIRVTLCAPSLPPQEGVKLHRGWNEVEFPITGLGTGVQPVLVLFTSRKLEEDLKVSASWWRLQRTGKVASARE